MQVFVVKSNPEEQSRVLKEPGSVDEDTNLSDVLTHTERLPWFVAKRPISHRAREFLIFVYFTTTESLIAEIKTESLITEIPWNKARFGQACRKRLLGAPLQLSSHLLPQTKSQ